MYQPPQNPKGQGIVHPIEHAYAMFRGLKEMLVVPNSVRANALLIHEVLLVFHVGDLCGPFHTDTKQGRNTVVNEKTFIHALWHGAKDFKAQVFRRDFGQIVRRGEEFPGLRYGDGQLLGAFEYIHALLTLKSPNGFNGPA